MHTLWHDEEMLLQKELYLSRPDLLITILTDCNVTDLRDKNIETSCQLGSHVLFCVIYICLCLCIIYVYVYPKWWPTQNTTAKTKGLSYLANMYTVNVIFIFFLLSSPCRPSQVLSCPWPHGCQASSSEWPQQWPWLAPPWGWGGWAASRTRRR